MKTFYIVIRIPKCGSQTLEEMVLQALPASKIHQLPSMFLPDRKPGGLSEAFRRQRRFVKQVIRTYGTWTVPGLWKKLYTDADDGSIITGHIPYGVVDIKNAELRNITLMRHPIQRAISHYNYSRQRYLNRPALRRNYMKGEAGVAGRGSFLDHLKYQMDRMETYANPQSAFITGTTHPPDPHAFLKEHYFHYGILEEAGLFASGLSEKLNQPVDATWKNRTSKKERTQPSPEETDLLNQLLEKDLEVYHALRDELADSHPV